MTETTETVVTSADTPAASRSLGVVLALLISLLALTLAIVVVVAPRVPALQRLLPPAPQEEPRNYDAAIGILQHQLGQLNQKVDGIAAIEAPVADLSPLEGRITTIEHQLAALTTTVEEMRERSAAVQPAGLAFIRVETRLLRGEPYRPQLDLLRQLAKAPLTPEQDRDLSAAASGVATTDVLIARLREHERAARRAERLGAADNPLDRIWAELRSLVLIKDSNDAPVTATQDTFDALIAAVRTGDRATTNAAWMGIAPAAQKVLHPVYAEVERRQRAEAALHEMAPVFLAVQ